jgi:hypothetical protein
MKTQNPFMWENYNQHPPEVRIEMLVQIERLLPDLTVKEQADLFSGAPTNIILQFLPKLCDEAQEKVYREYLPVGGRGQAKGRLSEAVKLRLKLKKRFRCLA